jgi:hypothetical protein
MPAARPSKATLNNALEAIIDAGLTPGVLTVGPDGSFHVEIMQGTEGAIAPAIAVNENEPEKYGDL